MSITVKALMKDGPNEKFYVGDLERRDLREDDVYIDIKAAGICHSDIHTIRNEWGEAHFPLTVGHEIAGVVTEVGSKVTRFKVGDRVGVGCLVYGCGTCKFCEVGREQFCESSRVGTYDSVDIDGTITQGGYSQGIVVNERSVLRLPDSIDFDEAAPLLCAGITTYSPLSDWKIKPGDKVAVMGLGGLGHMAVQIAAAMGAEVTVLSRSLRKAELAETLGAKRTLATTEEGFFDKYKNEFDFILNTISADIDLDAYVGLLRPQGVMVVVALPSEAQKINFGSIIAGNRILAGSNIGGIAQTQEMLDFCAEHGLKAMIEKIDVDYVDEAYERVVKGDVMFRFVIDTSTFEK